MIYFVQNMDTGRVKIGLSDDPVRRLGALQTANGSELRLLRTMPGDEQVEAELHARFQHLRQRGEWFAPDDELLEFVGAGWQRDDGLADLFVHTVDDDGWLQYQGRVVREVGERVLIEVFSWWDGMSDGIESVPRANLDRGIFYRTAEEMRLSYKCGRASTYRQPGCKMLGGEVAPRMPGGLSELR